MSRWALSAGLVAAVGLSIGLAGSAAAADEAARVAQGKALFVEGAAPACGICHTLSDAGTSGAVGPVLDELKPSAERVATALKMGVGVMPSYSATLSAAQIEALAAYVSKASGGAK